MVSGAFASKNPRDSSLFPRTTPSGTQDTTAHNRPASRLDAKQAKPDDNSISNNEDRGHLDVKMNRRWDGDDLQLDNKKSSSVVLTKTARYDSLTWI